MRDYAKISPQFWIGKTGRAIRALGIEAQLIALYLLTCPHATMLGIYYLPLALISHETGIPLEGAWKGLRTLCEINFCTYDDFMEHVWVHEMAAYQIGSQLKATDNRIKAIQEAYQNLPELSFLSEFYEKYAALFFLKNVRLNRSPFEGTPKPLRSQEQEQEKEQEQEQEGSAAQNAAPPAVLPPPVIYIPLNVGEYLVTTQQLSEWQKLYPSVDVPQTLRHIRGWNLANPKKRKTKSGILKHITGWLAKEQNQTRTRASPKNNLFEHNQSIANDWLNHKPENIIEGETVP